MGRARITFPRFGLAVYLTLTCLAVLLVLSRPAYAQVDEGAITGTVQDSSGAVVPDALVTLVNIDQGITLETKSSSSGGYTFSPVRIGNYEITVTAKGFSKTTQKNVHVNVAQVVQANIALKPGAATETVEVNTAPPVLQTEEASVGQVIGEAEVNNLPLNGRNFTFLAQLGAGMQTPQADGRGNAANGAFSANGLRPSQNNYLIDGIDNNSNTVDFLNGTNFVILPPVDAIQEFKVQTADFSAELGRAGGAVLNATIKSGTNSLHGAAWEFFRNDKLDAADWFENNNGQPKGRLRQNQFGASAGGPIIKNHMFIFGDYEGFRRVHGTPLSGNVPTDLMRSSGYTDLSDLLTPAFNSGNRTDGLGRSIPRGTVLDPATTRFVRSGATDPVSGLTNTSGGDAYVRDPFGTCAPSTRDFSGGCGLNQLPSTRIDPNAVALLNLYPAPNSPPQTYATSPGLFEHRNQFDVRGDLNPNDKNQIFARYSFSDDPIFIPGIFGGVADGGSFSQGLQTARSHQMVAGYTHVFSPNVVNQGRAGFAHLHTTRFGPVANQAGIPEKYGIQGIPQPPTEGKENGGLPAFGIGGLAQLGSNGFLPSDEISQTLQATDDFTRIYGKHSFKMGVEYQNVKFNTLQPGWSHGQFNFGGGLTDIPGQGTTVSGIAQMVLPTTAFSAGNGAFTSANDPNGFNYSGGSDGVFASNINTTHDQRIYFATYFQDDWKVTPSLTLNLGVRWDYFGPINESSGGQANFVPTALPSRNLGGPTFLLPNSGPAKKTLSTGHPSYSASDGTTVVPASAGTCNGIGCYGFVDLAAKDGITILQTNRWGKGLVQTEHGNVAPRVGFAYEVNPKLVVRGGFGLFFNSFENQGYSPNIGENYPFVFNLSYFNGKVAPGDPSISSQVSPISYNSPFSSCGTAGGDPAHNHGTASFESGLSCIPLNPESLNALGVGLEGMQFDFQTPRTYSSNLSVQYSLTHSLAAQAAYVFTQGGNLQTNVGYNLTNRLLPSGISTTSCGAFADYQYGSCVPFPDFGGGSYAATLGASTYHALQTKLEDSFSNGLTFLLTYTWSKTMSDAGDLLNGGASNNGSNSGPFRALGIPGLGPRFDWGPANFDVRNVVHFSGGYQLPFGKGMKYLNQGGLTNVILGGWAANWIVTAQGGQPVDFSCPSGTVSGAGCRSVLVKGQSLQKGVKIHQVGGQPRPFWFNNAKAFNQPCQLWVPDPINAPTVIAPHADNPSGCIPLEGAAALGSKPGFVYGPGVHRFDFSIFKKFPITERVSTEFRAEFFNILNHPNFNPLGINGDFTSPTFGELTSTRFNPYDPRQIQFALKLYY
jgi:hypothetical protein